MNLTTLPPHCEFILRAPSASRLSCNTEHITATTIIAINQANVEKLASGVSMMMRFVG